MNISSLSLGKHIITEDHKFSIDIENKTLYGIVPRGETVIIRSDQNDKNFMIANFSCFKSAEIVFIDGVYKYCGTGNNLEYETFSGSIMIRYKVDS